MAKICIDPGHGGSDPGAVNRSTKLRECDINLIVAKFLERMLQDHGYQCMLTRTGDFDVSYPGSEGNTELQARCAIANEWGADLFISIHCDSFDNPAAQGTSTYYYSEPGMKLAENIQKHLASRLGRYNRGIKPAGYFVLKHTDMPAVLTEGAFISNPQEAALLATQDFQYLYARSVFEGIEDTLGINTLTTQENATTAKYNSDDWSDAGLRNKMNGG